MSSPGSSGTDPGELADVEFDPDLASLALALHFLEALSIGDAEYVWSVIPDGLAALTDSAGVVEACLRILDLTAAEAEVLAEPSSEAIEQHLASVTELVDPEYAESRLFIFHGPRRQIVLLTAGDLAAGGRLRVFPGHDHVWLGWRTERELAVRGSGGSRRLLTRWIRHLVTGW